MNIDFPMTYKVICKIEITVKGVRQVAKTFQHETINKTFKSALSRREVCNRMMSTPRYSLVLVDTEAAGTVDDCRVSASFRKRLAGYAFENALEKRGYTCDLKGGKAA